MGTAAESPAWYRRFTVAESDEESELYRVLADERRRTVLAVLRRCDTPVSASRLARLLAARDIENPSNAVAAADRERVNLSLHHVQLPRLEAAGLIERTDEDRIDRTRHPFWTDESAYTLLEREDVSPATTTETFDVLADPRRRAVLTLLRGQRELTVGEIAAALAETPLSGQQLPRLTAKLVHSHVPKLAAAGVVELDSTGEVVRYTGNVVLDEWFSHVRTQREA